LCGRELVPSAGIARSAAADFRVIVEATASAMLALVNSPG